MDAVHTLTQRNAEFATRGFTLGLPMMPSLKTFIIGCVDPRVDPAQILGIKLGEVAVIRNIGGRITSSVLAELALLRKLTQGAGGDFDRGFNIILLQHTDCGILRMQGQSEQLADFFGIDTESLEAKKSAIREQPSRSTSPSSKPIPGCPSAYARLAWSTTWPPEKSTPSSRQRQKA